jgi:integrase
MGSVEKRTRTNKNGKVTTFYLARWYAPDGSQPSKSFPKKRLAEDHVIQMEGEILRGEYIDPNAGKVTFREYGRMWLAAQSFEPTTRDAVMSRLETHAFPVLGDNALSAIKPTTVQAWLRGMDGIAASTRRVVLVHVGAIMAAAVDDELIRKNPCKAKSIRRPKVARTKVVPWEAARLRAVHAALPDRYKVLVILGAGLGLRQGEIFGLANDDVDLKRGRVIIRRQVKLVGGHRVFGLPKYDKVREVPLPESVRDALQAHAELFPPVSVTLPWRDVDGDATTASLVVTNLRHRAVKRGEFNVLWKRALRAVSVPDTRENGCHMLRHIYASTLLHHGESIKALSEYLGHSDPGFTLRVYTHLMPGSDERTRQAVDTMFRVTGV